MKSPFSNCEECELRDQSLVFGETNSPNDIRNVDVLILAEAPSHDEKKNGRPLIGRAGSIFRSAFQESGLNKFKYIISNVVLCTNIKNVNGRMKTFNPSDETIERCKPNWMNLIKESNPKLILVLGGSPSLALGFGRTGIAKRNGSFDSFNGISVLMCFHPSYVVNNGGLGSSQYKHFVESFKKAVYFIEKYGVTREVDNKISEEARSRKLEYSFILPEWCYTDKINLVDVQNMKSNSQLLFTFKDDDGNKKYHIIPNTEYYYYERESQFEDSPHIENLNNLRLVKGRPDKDQIIGRYDSGIKTEDKYSVDYYYIRRNLKLEECKSSLNIMHADIEVYNEGRKDFPDPIRSECPINAISFKINKDKTNVWIVKLPTIDKEWENIDLEKEFPQFNVRFFETEEQLLISYANLVSSGSIDMITGWNWRWFDIPTIFGRLYALQLSPDIMSPIKKSSFNRNAPSYNYIGGVIIEDSLDLYKEFTYEEKESYKLSSIAQAELGKDKVTVDSSLDIMFETDIRKFILYSGTDTDLLGDLDEKLGHIALKQELIKVTGSNWNSAKTTMGQVAPIVHSFLKDKGLTFRENSKIRTGDKIDGAFVLQPKAGIHTILVDFDFASLYPNISRTYNIGPNTIVGKIDSEIAAQYIYHYMDENPSEVEVDLRPLFRTKQFMNVSYEEFENWINKNNYIVTITGAIFKSHDEELSILYEIFSYLLDSRSHYKNLMKEAKRNKEDEMFKKYKNIQMAYKILANSIYGVLANENFFLFATLLALTITASGQEAIKNLCYCLSNYMDTGSKEINKTVFRMTDSDVLPYIAYGDTDSNFVQLGDWLLKKGEITID